MKKLIALILTMVFTLNVYSQVSVNPNGDSPDIAAMMDVNAPDLGFLIPRVALVSTTDPIGVTKPNGLLVWNTSTTGTYSTPGFYFWDGTDWKMLISEAVMLSQISDADGDTKITVENSPDEDTIRFFVAGNEAVKLDGKRMELLNGGNYLIIGEGAGENNDPSNDANTFIGYKSSRNNAAGGNQNLSLGYEAMYSNVVGDSNIAIGNRAGYSNNYAPISNNSNLFIGHESGYSNGNGHQNIMIGNQAGYSATYGNGNIFIGHRAGYNHWSNNQLIIANSATNSPLIFGDFNAPLLEVRGSLTFNSSGSTNTLPTDRGISGQVMTTDGVGNLYWSTLPASGVTGSGATNRVAYWTGTGTLGSHSEFNWNPSTKRLGIGTSSPNQQLEITKNFRLPVTGSGNGVIYAGDFIFVHNQSNGTFVGRNAGNLTMSGVYNAAVGIAALSNNTNGGSNTAIGTYAMNTNSSGYANTALGAYSVHGNTTGTYNIGVGSYALYTNSTGTNNIAIGKNSMRNGSGQHHNIAIGDSAGYVNTGSYNILLGYKAGTSITTGSKNVYIGMKAGESGSSGTLNIGIGDSCAYNNIGHDNLFFGRKSGRWNQNGDYNIYIGNSCGFGASLNPMHNVLIGHESAYAITSGARNTLIGNYSGRSLTVGFDNVFIGDSAAYNLNEGFENVMIGQGSGKNCNDMQAYSNTFVGYHTGYLNTTGKENIFLGYQAGLVNTSGWQNIFIGRKAGKDHTTGHGNIFIGYEAGTGSEDGYNNIVIGNSGDLADDSHNIIWIGTRTGLPAIFAKYESVVVSGDSTDNTSSLTFYVNGTAGGPSGWQTITDGSGQRNIQYIPDALAKVRQLNGVFYDGKSSTNGLMNQQMGFIAQELERVVPQVVSSRNDSYSMQYGPLTALLVESVKEQQDIIDKQAEDLEKLRSEIKDLRAMVESLFKSQ
jgi:hypothetical protein